MIKLKVINIVIFLLLVPIVYGSYAVSSPKKIILEKGGFGEFDFQIQAYESEQDLMCSYELGDTMPFEIMFEKESFEVSKGRAIIVKGTVKAPKRIDKGDYSYDFCVGCSAKTNLEGAATKVNYCGIPIRIEITAPGNEFPIEIIILIVLLIVILIIFWIILFARKKGKKSLKRGKYKGKGKKRKNRKIYK